MFGLDWKIIAVIIAALCLGGTYMGFWRFEDFIVFGIAIGGIGYFIWTCFEQNKKYTLGGMG